MPDDSYTLADLARLADVTPRTVRYYVAQGLLPSPDAAGPSTRYGPGYLARIRLIRRLQRDHLPLAEIRNRLERMGDDEIAAAVAALDAVEPEPSQDPDDTLGFVRSLMARTGVRSTTTPPGRAAQHPVIAIRAMAEPSLAAPAAPSPASPSMAVPAPARTAHDRSTWERLVISPDVELHVRRPLDRVANKRVDQLERIARELFDDT